MDSQSGDQEYEFFFGVIEHATVRASRLGQHADNGTHGGLRTSTRAQDQISQYPGAETADSVGILRERVRCHR